MKLSKLVLSVCLLASFGCGPDIDNLNLDLGPELLTVNVTTVGDNLDADGYTLAVTGEPEEAIGINASRTFSVLPIDITIELRGVAGNCTVAANPRTIRVDASTTTTFVVECS